MDGARSEASGRSAEVGGQDGVTVQPTEGAGPATPPTYPSNTAVIFAGTVVHSEKVPELSLLEHSLVGVLPDGKIAFVGPEGDEVAMIATTAIPADDWLRVRLSPTQWLMPGLIDSHVHASQYLYTGTGYDMELLDWLKKYTFPTEAKYGDRGFAAAAYAKAVRRHLLNGTTTACYFATIHREGTMALVDAVDTCGQRAFVGKVCMDRNAPDYYVESTQDSIADTESFVDEVLALGNPLIQPVITPRFVPTCTTELLQELGSLAQKRSVLVQSHLSESKSEIAWVKELHPDHSSYTHVYDSCGLLNKDKTVMAHCVHLSDDEIETILERGTGVAHCASSNFCLMSGVMPVRKLLSKGVKVGLGTDVAGGYSPSILDAARQAITASKVHQLSNSNDTPLSWKEALALATLGGAQALGVDANIGNFVVGKAFDALVVDTAVTSSPFDVQDADSLEDMVSKFVFLGDDRNIVAVYVNGVNCLPTCIPC